MDTWSGGASCLVAEDGILVCATTHQLVAVIELCKLMAADPGTSAASGSYPGCRGFGARRWMRGGWTCGAAEASIPRRCIFFVVLNFFELIWGFILYDFWSPTEAERFKNTGRLSDFCFCYLLEFR